MKILLLIQCTLLWIIVGLQDSKLGEPAFWIAIDFMMVFLNALSIVGEIAFKKLKS